MRFSKGCTLILLSGGYHKKQKIYENRSEYATHLEQFVFSKLAGAT